MVMWKRLRHQNCFATDFWTVSSRRGWLWEAESSHVLCWHDRANLLIHDRYAEEATMGELEGVQCMSRRMFERGEDAPNWDEAGIDGKTAARRLGRQ